MLLVKVHRLQCEWCEKLDPEYEKAASPLSAHQPPIVLAKVDGSAKENKELSDQFEITGYPTIVILQNQGKDVRDYLGPREADGIVRNLKKLIGPPSAEIKTAKDALSLIDEDKISIVGIFPRFSVEEFENFTILADKLRCESWDYDFFHTLDSGLLPQGGSSVTKPFLRLLKPYDELFVDFQNFQVHAMETFIVEAGAPLVTILDHNTSNKQYRFKFHDSLDDKAMLYVDFTSDKINAFKSNYHDVAALYKCKGVSFLLADAVANKNDLEYFGLKYDQAPLIILLGKNDLNYVKSNLEPYDIAPWLEEYKDGKLKPFIKSQPIPESNNEPVRMVVTDSLQDMFFNSTNNVLLDIYVPWCGDFRIFAPVIYDIAILFENDADVIIASLDGTRNDVPNEIFDVKNCHTLYFKSASGKLLPYDGDQTNEDIIKFIHTNRDNKSQPYSSKPVKGDQ